MTVKKLNWNNKTKTDKEKTSCWFHFQKKIFSEEWHCHGFCFESWLFLKSSLPWALQLLAYSLVSVKHHTCNTMHMLEHILFSSIVWQEIILVVADCPVSRFVLLFTHDLTVFLELWQPAGISCLFYVPSTFVVNPNLFLVKAQNGAPFKIHSRYFVFKSCALCQQMFKLIHSK